ncbi:MULTISPECIES: flagellin [Bacillus cereus group]|uniref:flagellin n=1 Tax=Bacillus cereus group TaxID=86661 RepID=UPI0033969BA4
MRIGTNVLSMNASQSLYENEKRMKMATGKKLNTASDTPANVAIVTRMHARASGIQVAIRKIEEALQNISLYRADLGAMMKRLQFNIENLNNQSLALTGASSRIEDADMAQEMSDFFKFKLLTEVALSMVSQANQIPQMVSKLLQS